MEDAVANARTGRSDSVLSTIWRGVACLSHCNRLVEIRSRMLEIRENALRVCHEVLHPETNTTVARSTLTEARSDSSTRKPCPLPPEIQRRPLRHDASTALRALEFAIPGQW
jgi:hypothetical protein